MNPSCVLMFQETCSWHDDKTQHSTSPTTWSKIDTEGIKNTHGKWLRGMYSLPLILLESPDPQETE